VVFNQQYSIFVFADEPVLLHGLQYMLSGTPRFRLAEMFDNIAQMAGAAEQYQPSVILYTLSLDPDLAQIKALRRITPDSRIILWTREFSTELGHAALEMGIKGFLSTTASAETVLECLRFAASGELWMERGLASSMLNSRPVALSPRQTQLLSLLVQGLKNREIAAQMGISEGTVKAYLTTIFEKVGARDRFELALFGMKSLPNIRAAQYERVSQMTRSPYARTAVGR
jgi:DNA-binding NarL/FixJ family response regulator